MKALPFLLAVFLCPGCATSVLYNEARDKQGQEAKKATAEVHLAETITQLDKKFKALSELEIAVLKERAATTRNFEIEYVAATDSPISESYVQFFLDFRIKKLTGNKIEVNDQRAWVGDAAALLRFEKNVAGKARLFEAVARIESDCASARKWGALKDRATPPTANLSTEAKRRIPAARQPLVQAPLGNLIVACNELEEQKSPDFEKKRGLPQGSEIVLRQAELKKDREAHGRYQADLAEEQTKLKELQKTFASEVDALAPTVADETYLARLSKAAAALEKGADGLAAAAGKLGSAHDYAIAIEKLEALETVLGAVATGVSDPSKLSSDQRTAVAVVRLIPSIADEADKLLKEAKKPRLGPLMLAKEHQRVIVDGFEAQAALDERRILLREKRLNAAIAELQALFQARLALEIESARERTDQVPARESILGVNINKKLTEIQSGAQEVKGVTEETRVVEAKRAAQEKRRLYESFGFYFDDAHRFRVEQDVLRLQINAMTYESVMQASKTGAQAWESLITNISTILATYHSAGVKPADIAEFVKALGLFYIGR